MMRLQRVQRIVRLLIDRVEEACSARGDADARQVRHVLALLWSAHDELDVLNRERTDRHRP